MKSFLSWSTGKDAAYTLLQLIDKHTKPDLLLTTVNKDFGRVSMHGVRNELLELQADSIRIPVHKIPLSKDVDMATYNQIMQNHLLQLRQQEFNRAVFGDIFLEDLRVFREKQFQKVGFNTHFPIWKTDTKLLANKIIQSGIKAIVVAINASKLNKSFAGRLYDETFLKDLPKDVDPCGENGEFHTFVYDAPYFKSPINFSIGEKIFKTYKPCSESDQNTYKSKAKNTEYKWDTGFWYVDLLTY